MLSAIQTLRQDLIRTLPWLVPFTLVMVAIMDWAGTGLKNPVAPLGIFSFQFAGNLEQAHAILAAWGTQGRLVAAFTLGLDYLFLLTYTSAIAAVSFAFSQWIEDRRIAALGTTVKNAVENAAQQGGVSFYAVAPWVGAGQLITAVMDMTENAACLALVYGHEADFLPVLVRACAAVKFSFLALGLLFVIVSGLRLLMLKRGR